MLSENQLPERLRTVIDEQTSVYNQGRSITQRNAIPDTSQIPIDNPSHWLRIPQVICVFVDMLGSTRLSAENHDNSTAGAYQLFTGTAVRLFHEFEAPYIDVRGDGVFALFNSDQPYRALAAAVSFKTFAKEVFVPTVREKTQIEVGCHIGIDQKTVLVRKLGLKQYHGRTDRQNEVWAGKPINMASKLASRSQDGELFVSDRYFEKIQNNLVLLSCGCPGGEKKQLWIEADVSDVDLFDFDTAWVLKSCWCSTHGTEYCEGVLALDAE